VPDTRALEMLILHDLGEPDALDGIDELLASLPKDHKLALRLAALR
jgi:hypothetical protein